MCSMPRARSPSTRCASRWAWTRARWSRRSTSWRQRASWSAGAIPAIAAPTRYTSPRAVKRRCRAGASWPAARRMTSWPRSIGTSASSSTSCCCAWRAPPATSGSPQPPRRTRYPLATLRRAHSELVVVFNPMLTILGGGGWFPAYERHTACALLRDGNSAIMIDAGTGVSRFVERDGLLDGVERLDILLTHFHLDHVAGLAYLPALGLCEYTAIWGPGKLLYGTPTHAILARVSNEPFHPVPLEEQDLVVRDIPAGELELPTARVTFRRQDRHTAPSLAFRFDDALTWITDTAYDPDSAQFAEGSKLLAQEAWFLTSAPRNPDIHSSAAQAGQVAADAGVERLMLIHLPPFDRSNETIGTEAQG